MRLGRWDVTRWLGEISWCQLVAWHEYDLIDPFSEERADLRAAQVVAMVANTNLDTSKREPYSPMDFILRFDSSSVSVPAARRPITDPKQWGEIKDRIAASVGLQ